MRLKIIYSAVLVMALSIPSATNAQNWFSKAQSLIGSETGSQVLKNLGSSNNNGNIVSNLSNSEISSALREALTIGTSKVVEQIGTVNGFNSDPKIRIPLPNTLSRVDSALSAIGMNSLTQDLELRLNRAAEAATPKAKELFINAISQMSIQDAQSILTGSSTSATEYLRKTTGVKLGEEMQPIIQSALASAGAISAYDNVIGQYSKIPFMPDVKSNLNNYVVEKAMDGIFYYVAKEEAAIRSNPAARTTDLLKKVFAQ